MYVGCTSSSAGLYIWRPPATVTCLQCNCHQSPKRPMPFAVRHLILVLRDDGRSLEVVPWGRIPKQKKGELLRQTFPET